MSERVVVIGGLEDRVVVREPYPRGPRGQPGPAGPPGPEGPQGKPGGFGQSYAIAVPATVWRLPHDAGVRHVDVQTFDDNDEEIFGDVYFFDGYVEVHWYYPTVGTARVSL